MNIAWKGAALAEALECIGAAADPLPKVASAEPKPFWNRRGGLWVDAHRQRSAYARTMSGETSSQTPSAPTTAREVPIGSGAITVLLSAASRGDPTATDALFRAVYAELQALARSHRRRWLGNETMNTTALVHEAFLKLAGRSANRFANRTHFFATASKAMRQVLVNYAEQQGASKRGGDAMRVALEEVTLASQASADEVLDLDRALTRLERESPRRCQIAECRLFGGMTVEEIADALSLSPATVKREWAVASAQLYRQLRTE